MSPSTGFSGGRSGNPHHAGVEFRVLGERGKGPPSLSPNVMFVMHCVLHLIRLLLPPKLPTSILRTLLFISQSSHLFRSPSFTVWIRQSDRSVNHSPPPSAPSPSNVASPPSAHPSCSFGPALSTPTMGPAPLNVTASPSPGKTPKISGPSVNGAAKQPAAAKNIAPSDISSPHELTAFVRFYL